MERWQHLIIDNGETCCNPDDVVGLDYLGNEGWELVSVAQSNGRYGGKRFYFKRPVSDDNEYGNSLTCEHCGYCDSRYMKSACPRCGK